jgi:peptide/nickel transport system ATP-binding protein
VKAAAARQRSHGDFGMSIVYITHDLTTAYQISDNIIVLYRGTVAEAGDVALVVRQPRHPYTQLLVQSVPKPDPSERWGSFEIQASPVETLNGTTQVVDLTSAGALTSAHGGHLVAGCQFADRCPYVIPTCRSSTPPLFRLDAERAATCFRYRDRPVLASQELEQVMHQPVKVS